MLNLLSLLIGGTLGILGRYGALLWLGRSEWMGMPLGTFTVNMLGSLLIGLLWGALDVPQLSDAAKNFLFIGLLGGFTTFSSLALEVMQRFQAGDVKSAMLYMLLTNVLGVLLVFVGFWLGAKLQG